MTQVHLILGDQLSANHPFLKSAKNNASMHLVMIESLPRAQWLPYHPQKLLFLYSCMRRFALELARNFPNIKFTYVRESQLSIGGALKELGATRVSVITPAEPRVTAWLKTDFGDALELVPSPFFLATDADLPKKPPYLMEFFYRKMRKATGALMTPDGDPLGGQWNYDEMNRASPSKDFEKSPPEDFLKTNWRDADDEAIGIEVEAMLKPHLNDNRFGSSKIPPLPTHPASARRYLNDFILKRLPLFGQYEDAMVTSSVGLYHSGLSALMNLQILSVREILDAVCAAETKVPINSIEGFVRQIIGWREFIHLIYQRHHELYRDANFFELKAPLPPLYWGAPTQMRCLSHVVANVRDHAYSHHIERLMILGNFSLLNGVAPAEINTWFWATYLDAYEWVVTPNVVGMSQFADGGLFATKPYVSSANYINKMSTYCKGCKYDYKLAVGENSCPFNSLYWNFIDETQAVKDVRPSFAQRMSLMWASWNRKSAEEKSVLKQRAAECKSASQRGTL